MSNLRSLLRPKKDPPNNLSSSQSAAKSLPKYDKLLSTLKSPVSSLNDKIIAAEKLVLWIQSYHLGNPCEPWVAGKRLIHFELSVDARHVGYRLLKACILSRGATGDLGDISDVVRLMFFHDIQNASLTSGSSSTRSGTAIPRYEDLDLQIDALITLTRDGREINGIHPYIATLLCSWIDTSLYTLQLPSKLSRRGAKLSTSERHEDLRAIMGLVTQITKFHFSVLSEEDIAKLIAKIVDICQKTGEPLDISAALIFFDSIIRFGYIHITELYGVIKVLCSVYSAKSEVIREQQDQAMSVMQNLLKSHMSEIAVQMLRNVVEGRVAGNKAHEDVIIGSIEMLTTLLIDGHSMEDREDDKKPIVELISINSLVETLWVGLGAESGQLDEMLVAKLSSPDNQIPAKDSVAKRKRDIQALDLAIVRAAFRLVSTSHIRSMMSFDDWDRPIEIFIKGTRSAKMFTSLSTPNDREKAPEGGLDGVVHAIYAQIIDFFVGLCQQTLFVGSMPKLLNLLTAENLYASLPESACMMILNHYDKELCLFPNNPNYLQNIKEIGRLFFLPEGRDNLSGKEQVRLVVLRQISDVINVISALSSDDTMSDDLEKLHHIVLDLLTGIGSQARRSLKSSLESVKLVSVIAMNFDRRTLHPSSDLNSAKRASLMLFQLTELPRRREALTILSQAPSIETNPGFENPIKLLKTTSLAGTMPNMDRRASVESALSLVTTVSSVAKAHESRQNGLRMTNSTVAGSGYDYYHSGASDDNKTEQENCPLSRGAVEALSALFLKAFLSHISMSASFFQFLWEGMLKTIVSSHYFDHARLSAISIFARFRADSMSSVYLEPELDQIISTTSEALEPRCHDNSVHNHGRGEMSQYFSDNSHFRVNQGSGVQHLEAESSICSTAAEKQKTLQIGQWLDALVQLLRMNSSWIVVNAVHEALLAQLSNKQLFSNCSDELRSLRQLICDYLLGSKNLAFSPNQLPADLKREDIMAVMIKILTLLVSYHDTYSKVQEDEIVTALQSGLMKYQKAATTCIHALTVCAYEIPLSTSRILSSILIRLSQLITSNNASIHILEFLSSLAKLPDLYINFRDEDYRRVFEVALQHIQHVSAISRDAQAANNLDPLTQCAPVYVLNMAYDVLYVWFLALKLSQRPKYLKPIIDGLLRAGPSGVALDERGEVCFDFLTRFCYSNVEIKSITTAYASFDSESSSKRSWIYGNAILTLRTMMLSGLTEMTIRRPSGSISLLVKPNSDLEALSVLTSVEAQNIISKDNVSSETEEKIRAVLAGHEATAFTPIYVLLQTTIAPELGRNIKPIPLNDDDTLRRALASFDRVPVVDFHKIGIVYVGRGQSTQQEILANTYGAPDYVSFLESIGDLVRLKSNSIYTGGLDTTSDEDGEFAYYWKDKISQIIFHTCTLMPNRATDPSFDRKKAHIGNDFVNIIWNNSNKPYLRETIPSEFNYFNIVISPDAYQSRWFVHSDRATQKFYKVIVLAHPSVPGDFSPASEWRLISMQMLPNFVRSIAMHCNLYAQVSAPGGSFVSMWRLRLQSIQRLKQRVLERISDSKNNMLESSIPKTENEKDHAGHVNQVATGLDFTTYA